MQVGCALLACAPPWPARDRYDGPLIVRPLEDRRVLSAAVITTLTPPGDEGGIGGGGASPEAAGMALSNSANPPVSDAPPSTDSNSQTEDSAGRQASAQGDGDFSAGTLTADVSSEY